MPTIWGFGVVVPLTSNLLLEYEAIVQPMLRARQNRTNAWRSAAQPGLGPVGLV
jgi:hypothetical protein